MKDMFVETQNYIKIREKIARLKAIPITASARMGLFYGKWGLGKSYTLEKITAEEDALFLRASETWSKTSFLTLLCEELFLDTKGSADDKYKRVTEELNRKERKILIIDEIDAILRSYQAPLLEMIRGIHDKTGVILVYVGMEEAHAKFKRYGQHSSRIVELLKLEPVNEEDVEKFLKLCGVEIDKETTGYLARKFPNFRFLEVIISRIEAVCELNGVIAIESLKHYRELARAGGVEDGIA